MKSSDEFFWLNHMKQKNLMQLYLEAKLAVSRSFFHIYRAQIFIVFLLLFKLLILSFLILGQ